MQAQLMLLLESSIIEILLRYKYQNVRYTRMQIRLIKFPLRAARGELIGKSIERILVTVIGAIASVQKIAIFSTFPSTFDSTSGRTRFFFSRSQTSKSFLATK